MSPSAMLKRYKRCKTRLVCGYSQNLHARTVPYRGYMRRRGDLQNAGVCKKVQEVAQIVGLTDRLNAVLTMSCERIKSVAVSVVLFVFFFSRQKTEWCRKSQKHPQGNVTETGHKLQFGKVSWFWLGQLIFFKEICTRLWFGFLMTVVVITQSCFSCRRAYTGPRTYLLLLLPCQQPGWVCTRSWGGIQPGQLAQTDTTGIRLSNKTGGKKEEGGHIWSDGLCLPKKPLGAMSTTFLEVAECLHANGKQ